MFCCLLFLFFFFIFIWLDTLRLLHMIALHLISVLQFIACRTDLSVFLLNISLFTVFCCCALCLLVHTCKSFSKHDFWPRGYAHVQLYKIVLYCFPKPIIHSHWQFIRIPFNSLPCMNSYPLIHIQHSLTFLFCPSNGAKWHYICGLLMPFIKNIF